MAEWPAHDCMTSVVNVVEWIGVIVLPQGHSHGGIRILEIVTDMHRLTNSNVVCTTTDLKVFKRHVWPRIVGCSRIDRLSRASAAKVFMPSRVRTKDESVG